MTGLVKKPLELSLADLKAMPATDIVNGYECSGNSPRAMQGLSSNGRFTGVRLRDVLKRAGVGDEAREVVFFGADRGKEDVVFRQQTFKIEQQFARSITLENAEKPEPMLVYALNGQPLTRDSGFPVRLVMPGWYGVANVKWLSEIHLQEGRFLGNFQARWYRTVRTVGGTGGETDPETQWVETEVTRLQPQVGDRARDEDRRRAQGPRLGAERRHAAAVGRSEGGRRPVEARGARPRQHEALVEALHLHVGGRHARRAHHRVARHRRERPGAAHRRGPRAQEDVPRGQLADAAQGHDCVDAWSGRAGRSGDR